MIGARLIERVARRPSGRVAAAAPRDRAPACRRARTRRGTAASLRPAPAPAGSPRPASFPADLRRHAAARSCCLAPLMRRSRLLVALLGDHRSEVALEGFDVGDGALDERGDVGLWLRRRFVINARANATARPAAHASTREAGAHAGTQSLSTRPAHTDATVDQTRRCRSSSAASWT